MVDDCQPTASLLFCFRLEQSKKTDKRRDLSDHHQKPANDLFTKREVVTTETKPSPDEEQWRSEQRHYWERQLCIAKWLNYITAGAVVVGAVTIVVLLSQLFAARAWVGVSEEGPQLTSDISVDPTIGNIDTAIKYKVFNYSDYTATRVFSGSVAVVTANVRPTFNGGTRDSPCESEQVRRDNKGNPMQYGFALFPHTGLEQTVTSTENVKALEPFIATQSWVFVCIVYRDQFGKTHHTKSLYNGTITKVTPEHPNGHEPFKLTVPKLLPFDTEVD